MWNGSNCLGMFHMKEKKKKIKKKAGFYYTDGKKI